MRPLALLSFLTVWLRPAIAADSPIVGAIRWDAWSGGAITAQVTQTLSPESYRWRLPWFARVGSDGTVEIQADRPEIMEQEIAYAADAGLAYWAFVAYPEHQEMSRALGRYLASPIRQRLGFCLILHNHFSLPEEIWDQECTRLIALLGEPGYQRVCGGRPLIYAFPDGPDDAHLGHRMRELLQRASQEGLNPYWVYMGWNPAHDYERMRAFDCDAVSHYAYGSDVPTFAELAQQVEVQYWGAGELAGVPYIPLVTTGWDKRPRQDHPVPWEMGQSYLQQQVFPAPPTPDEIAVHLTHALTFIRKHPQLCTSNTALIYAWNEHDEGGWISPTWRATGAPDTSRLQAVATVLTHAP